MTRRPSCESGKVRAPPAPGSSLPSTCADGRLDYLCFECLAERTVAFGQLHAEQSLGRFRPATRAADAIGARSMLGTRDAHPHHGGAANPIAGASGSWPSRGRSACTGFASGS